MHWTKLMERLQALRPPRGETGASAVEYGLLVAGIAALVVSAVFAFGDSMNELLGESCGTITAYVIDKECS
jgi:pilus assembly protein Flp/PilA